MAWTEKEIETLIRTSTFSNPAHKRALRERLFEPVIELDLENLDAVAGGSKQTEPEIWKVWQTVDENRK